MIQNKPTPFKAYKIAQLDAHDERSFDVVEVTVTRYGILQGCTGVTVDVVEPNGDRYQASPDMFHETRIDGLEALQNDVFQTIRSIHESIDQLNADLNNERELWVRVAKQLKQEYRGD